MTCTALPCHCTKELEAECSYIYTVNNLLGKFLTYFSHCQVPMIKKAVTSDSGFYQSYLT